MENLYCCLIILLIKIFVFMDYPKHYTEIKTGRSSLENWLQKHYPEFYTYILNFYKGIDLKTAIYMFYNNISEIPLCKCGNPVKFHGYQYGFSKFCCSSCAGKDEQVQEKLKGTLIKKYGEKYREEIIQKGLSTKLKLYGDKNYNNKEKSRQTCLDKYGVDNPMKAKSIKEKSKQTCLKKYGNEYYLSSDDFLNKKEYYMEKSKQTCLDKYGNISVMSNQFIKDKVKQTCLKKYGVEWNCMRPEAKNSKNSNSGPNEHFANLLMQQCVVFEREFYLDGKIYDFKVGNTLIEINPSPTHNINWNPYGGKIMDKMYHLDKTELAKQNGYNMINIWDWDNMNKIIYLLKPKQRIYARSCALKEIDNKINNDFLNLYHCQNTCKKQYIRIGLFYKNELVAVMTFGKPRYNKKYDWELLRLCYHCDFEIIGGSQKMFNYFISKFNPKNIISYCDNSKFNGNIYEKLGFILKNDIKKPSKHWYNCKTKIHITDNLLRQRGFDQLFNEKYGKNINNQELMIQHGFVEIYDAGQKVYEWKKNI